MFLLAQVVTAMRDLLTQLGLAPCAPMPAQPAPMGLKQTTAQTLAWHDHCVPLPAGVSDKQTSMDARQSLRDIICSRHHFNHLRMWGNDKENWSTWMPDSMMDSWCCEIELLVGQQIDCQCVHMV